MSRASDSRGFTSVWGWPIGIGVASCVGLVSALVGDGVWDALSWAALAAPVAVSVRALMRRRDAGR